MFWQLLNYNIAHFSQCTEQVHLFDCMQQTVLYFYRFENFGINLINVFKFALAFFTIYLLILNYYAQYYKFHLKDLDFYFFFAFQIIFEVLNNKCKLRVELRISSHTSIHKVVPRSLLTNDVYLPNEARTFVCAVLWFVRQVVYISM